jgi:hypothetical protein
MFGDKSWFHTTKYLVLLSRPLEQSVSKLAIFNKNPDFNAIPSTL